MHKRLMLALTSISFLTPAMADTPGKKTMHESKLSFQNMALLTGYKVFYRFHYGDAAGSFVTDTTLVIPPSGGAPDGVDIWAVNIKTNQSTDTVTFSNYYSPDEVILLSAIKNDSLQFTKAGLSNNNEIINDSNAGSITNKDLIKEAEAVKKTHYYKIAAYSGAALLALVALAWFFMKRRNKQPV